ncbi:MAG: CooT family nickel-binding protein [Bacillota bacterium]|nr:CooT family nickel-binding protein [Bacillota bacterium]
MCEANVYMVDREGNEKLIIESVDKVISEGKNITLENIFSQKMTVKARIKEMALVAHRIILEDND